MPITVSIVSTPVPRCDEFSIETSESSELQCKLLLGQDRFNCYRFIYCSPHPLKRMEFWTTTATTIFYTSQPNFSHRNAAITFPPAQLSNRIGIGFPGRELFHHFVCGMFRLTLICRMHENRGINHSHNECPRVFYDHATGGVRLCAKTCATPHKKCKIGQARSLERIE